MPTDRLALLVLIIILLSGIVGLAVDAWVTGHRRALLKRRIDGLRGGRGDGIATRQSVGDITLRQGSGNGGLRGVLDRLFAIDRSLITAPGVTAWRVALFAVPAGLAAGWLVTAFAGMPVPVGVASGAGGALLMARQRYAGARRRTLARLLDQFPDAMGLVVRAIRSGIPVTESIRNLGEGMPAPSGPEFRRVADELAVGVELDAALRRLAERCGLPEYRFFVVAVVLQRETGGDLAETLELLAEVVRKRRAIRQRGHALSAEARTSAYVLAALPFVAMGSLYVLNPPYVLRLFTTPEGKMLLALAAGFLGAGMLTMQAMIRKALA